MSSDSPVATLASSLSLSGSSPLHDVARTVADYFSFVVNIRAWAETEVPTAPTAEERQTLKKVADLVAAENRWIDLAIQALTTIKAYNEEFIKTHDSSHTSLSEFWNQFYSSESDDDESLPDLVSNHTTDGSVIGDNNA
ncbi:hypothetical protein M378DRAFT_18005 [Amanita muscaria Koide BX008]|uniref:Uncharacterized protein n=1 Tax=Amanita muscaria (strain Koide BX008) TaxID=946122 RepID=A0A0C2WGY3_AMAMK|nr:hypothetical protein M378DRAFT_18005 [Amanita muscaria Koide BX008]